MPKRLSKIYNAPLYSVYLIALTILLFRCTQNNNTETIEIDDFIPEAKGDYEYNDSVQTKEDQEDLIGEKLSQVFDGSVESINKISNNKEIEKVSREIKKYTSEEHFKEDWESKEIFETLRNRIFDIDSQVEEVPTKVYIGYKLGNIVLFDLNIRKNKIEVHLYRIKPKDIKDNLPDFPETQHKEELVLDQTWRRIGLPNSP
jgi:hypothetical protein